MIAYAGAAESIGHTLQSGPVNPQAAFKMALRSVHGQPISDQLVSTLYGRRSATAHDGRFHGIEPLLGAIIWPEPGTTDEVATFLFTELAALRHAVWQLLLRALIAPTPSGASRCR